MHFFALMNGMNRRALHFDALEPLTSPEALLRGDERPSQAVAFRKKAGDRAYDLLGETYGVLKFVSAAFIKAFESNRVTGWSTFPVELRTQGSSGELAGYRGLAVTGRSGPIDRSRSQIVERLTRGGKGGVLYAEIGLYVDKSTWDGSDLFIPEGSSVVCLSEAARGALDGAGLTNVRLVPNEEYQLMLHSTPPARTPTR
jgi:hypothetical protein